MNANERRQLLARASAAGALLVLVVIVTSAFLRLVQFGVGCADWPACYGAVQLVPGAGSPAYAKIVLWMRVMHRLAAAAVGVIALAVAVAAWGRPRRRAVICVAAALLALTLFLAVLGRVTPSTQLPAVTLGNVLGGMAMLGLFWWLWLETSALPPRGSPPLLWASVLGLVLLAAQFGLGTLVSANHASAACPGFPGCGGVTTTAGWDYTAFDPWRLAAGGDAGEAARQTLHMAHRWMGWIVLAYSAGLARLWWRRRVGERKWIAAAVILLCIQFALGVAVVLLDVPLAITVAHNGLAGALLVTFLTLVFQSRPADEAIVSAACQMVTSK
jgi:cytochrome c oxidase assembly protein subunit 15